MFGIPTSKELTDAGIALEDHAATQLASVLHGVLDRINGTTLKLTEGGAVLVIPPAPAPPQS